MLIFPYGVRASKKRQTAFQSPIQECTKPIKRSIHAGFRREQAPTLCKPFYNDSLQRAAVIEKFDVRASKFFKLAYTTDFRLIGWKKGRDRAQNGAAEKNICPASPRREKRTKNAHGMTARHDRMKNAARFLDDSPPTWGNKNALSGNRRRNKTKKLRRSRALQQAEEIATPKAKTASERKVTRAEKVFFTDSKAPKKRCCAANSYSAKAHPA